jgi:hypothetical protein
MEAHVFSFFQKIHFSVLTSKLFLTVFWESQRPNFEIDMVRGTTVTSVNCFDMLRDEMRPAIRTNQRGQSSQDIFSLHENAPPHTTHLTINTIQNLNWEVLEHPAHGPDLAHSDFLLFGPLKSALRSSRFVDSDKSSSVIRKHADLWAKCIEKKGNYI